MHAPENAQNCFLSFLLPTVTGRSLLFLFNAIETNFLRASSTSEFLHSLGQKAKYSFRLNVVRHSPNIRHSAGPIRRQNLCRRHLISRLLAQATDRRMAYVLGSRNVCQHLSRLPASDCFPFLMVGQFRFPTEYYPPLLCPCSPLAGPRPDQLALKLGETAQNGQHQATVRRRGISPGIPERFEAGASFGGRPQQIEGSTSRVFPRNGPLGCFQRLPR